MILEDLLRGHKVGDLYNVRIPIYVDVSKKTTKAVNLNIYRNLHHHHLNTQKKNFADEVKPLLRGKPRAQKVWIHYTIFAARNGRLDTMNVGSIADKYFSDTLVEAGMIEDDDYDHIILSTFSFGGVRPMDGHAIATVNILKESEPMRIMLDEDDIQNALNTYVKTLGIPGSTGEVEITINGDDLEAEVLMEGVKPKNKGGRPRGSKTTKPTTTIKKPAPEKEEDADATETRDNDSEGSSDDSDSGGSSEPETEAEKPETKPTEAESKASKNLFGDSDEKASSDSPTNTETEDPKKVGGQTVKTKKSSIFDVD